MLGRPWRAAPVGSATGVGAGDRAGQGRDAGAEAAGFLDVVQAEFRQPATQKPSSAKVVQQSGGEGVACPDRVGDARRDGGHVDPFAVERGQGAVGTARDHDEPRPCRVPDVARLLGRRARQQEFQVVLAQPQYIREVTPVRQPAR